jgi:predicted phage baseplate assembly protein
MNSANDTEICRDEQRRNQARAKQRNGLDYVEVGPSQLTLKLFFIGAAPEGLTPANFRIDGGARIRGVRVTGADRVNRTDEDLDDYWRLTVDRFGDFSTYTLRIVKPDAEGRPGDEPLDDFDPRYSRLEFTFKSDCPSDLDCRAQTVCPPPPRPEPEINYLAKDYASFRQLILDRLAVVAPEWKERHVPDLGITLVELLAYTGDYLSYYQDAVATEAYLDTARRRISVRRHARLVDYTLHEGCNARAWVAVETSQDDDLDPADIFFITGYNNALLAGGAMLSQDDLRNIPANIYEVFEPLIDSRQEQQETIKLYRSHNEIKFYTWGDRECRLPRGATRATLLYEWKTETAPESDDHGEDGPRRQQSRQKGPAEQPTTMPEITPNLKSGDVLIFEEVKGAKTGNPADADPSRRHAVRLTRVTPGMDELYDKQIVEIEWAEADALPFALCVSSIGPADGCCQEITDVSVARGNVILVDHGRTIEPESFDAPAAKEEDAGCEAVGQPRDKTLLPAPFNPLLKFSPLTHREPFPQPRAIARRQARLLGKLMDRARELVNSLRRKAHDGQTLSTDELNALRTVFGRQAMIEVRLLDRGGAKWRKSTAAEQAVEIAKLITNEDRWLAKKLRRLATLRARAEADYVLDELAVREIGEMFGEQFGQELSPSNASLFGAAGDALRQDPREATPSVRLRETRDGQAVWWEPRRDLLDSQGDDRHFVAEIDNQGIAHLRFGDGEQGRMPEANAKLTARYRVGNGRAGNVGAETISHVVFRQTKKSGISLRPRNPLPARGGVDPESMAEAKMFAPGAFRKQLRRAIVADDYARLAEDNHKIQLAAAELRWTGSWLEACVAVDPLGGEETDGPLLEDIERYLNQYRRMGHDLRVKQARYVPLEIEMRVCVLPHHLRGHVKAALADLFSNRLLPGGRRGFFHPDNLTFGDGVYLSKLIALAQAVTGVESAQVTKLQRLFEPPNNEIENGALPLSPFEVAQLDNDPSFPERGKFTIDVFGGR